MLAVAAPVLFVAAVAGIPPNSFSNYPGYVGEAVTGSYTVHNAGSRLHISWAGLTGIDAACENGPTAAANSCGIHVHSGTSCSDASLVGGHYYTTNDDPWTSIGYTTGTGQVFVAAGLMKEDVHGRAMVIHAADGSRIGCSLIDLSVHAGIGDGSGDGDGGGGVSVSVGYTGPQLPCLNPSACQCPCGWEIGQPGATCRGSPGSVCMDSLGPNIVGPHMQKSTLEECKSGCEKTPTCVAVDHATHGDQRCWYYSACPSPNHVNSATVGPNAAYWGHRTICASGGCSQTNAPAGGLAALVGQVACGSTITVVTSDAPNQYTLTLATPTGGCNALSSCNSDIATLVENAAGVLSHQVSVSVDTCTDKRKAQALSGSATVTVTFSNPQPSSVSGDPFVSFGSKKTQIYLPVGQLRTLLKCQDMQLMGRVMDNGVARNDQWFDMFKVDIKGTEIISVMVNSNVSQSPQTESEAPVAVADAKGRVANLLNKLHQESADPAVLVAKNLTSLSVNVMSRPELTTGGPITSGAKVRIDQDTTKPIGKGFSESVTFENDGTGLTITSSVAHKYAYTDGKLAVHLDLQFQRLDAKMCRGPLPEIWGMHPMSKNTAKLLEPPALEI